MEEKIKALVDESFKTTMCSNLGAPEIGEYLLLDTPPPNSGLIDLPPSPNCLPWIITTVVTGGCSHYNGYEEGAPPPPTLATVDHGHQLPRTGREEASFLEMFLFA